MEETAGGERRRGRGLGDPGSGLAGPYPPLRGPPSGNDQSSGGSGPDSAGFRDAGAAVLGPTPGEGSSGRAGLPQAAGTGDREITLSPARGPVPPSPAPSHPLPWPLPSAEARMSSAMVCPASMSPVPLSRASPGRAGAVCRLCPLCCPLCCPGPGSRALPAPGS